MNGEKIKPESKVFTDKDGKHIKYGYRNLETGKMIVDYIFDKADSFWAESDFTSVKIGKNFGIIDVEGNVIIECAEDNGAEEIYENLPVLEEDNKRTALTLEDYSLAKYHFPYFGAENCDLYEGMIKLLKAKASLMIKKAKSDKEIKQIVVDCKKYIDEYKTEIEKYSKHTVDKLEGAQADALNEINSL